MADFTSLSPLRDNTVDELNRHIVQLNELISRQADTLAKIQGQDGQTFTLSGDIDLDGHIIRNAGRSKTNTDVPRVQDLRESGLYATPGQSLKTSKKIEADGGVTVPSTPLAQNSAINLDTLTGQIGGLDATLAPPKVDNASAIGTPNTHFAREQHTHQGVNLDAAQTIAGRKTHSTDIVVPLLLGSVASGGTLTLRSTEHATKGKVLLGASAYDEVNDRLGIGTATPTSTLQAVGLPVYANNAAAVTGGLTVGAFYRTGADPDPVCVVH